ncbi:replicative DNA helicase [Maribellus mangrovi]|uniref:replicative DNA helicase n=1 Tax=Maribellus mangrovi TaxID=3133146 RepID=UPI0030EE38EB
MKISETILDRLPPQAVDAEKAVLGALLLEKDVYEKISSFLDTGHFYLDSHQRIFEFIKKNLIQKQPVDLITVTKSLKDSSLLDSVGGPQYLTSLTQNVASAAHIEAHARIIAEMYYKRESIHKATEIISMSYDGKDVEEISHQWQNSASQVENIFMVADSGTHIRKVLKDTIEEINRDSVALKQKHSPGIPTGFQTFDNASGGWRNGDLNILAARPGVGKTSFALHFALHAAFSGYWVNFYSWEMKKEDLARILIAAVSDIYRSNIRDGRLEDEDWKRINKAVGQLENLPVIFRDASGMNIEQVQSTVRENYRHSHCDFVVIDYLQLISPVKKTAIREQEVAQISRTLKLIAQTRNIPVLALSQLNRTAEGERPKLSHLRESGAIEQDADNVLFLHQSDENQNMIQLTIAKHRRGRQGSLDISCNDQMTRFQEITLKS